MKIGFVVPILIMCLVSLTGIPLLNPVHVSAGILDSSAADTSITVTINGLENGDQATLTLSPEGSTKSNNILSQQLIQSKGDTTVAIEVPTKLADGYYQLLLETTEKYYREPKGYFFQVQNSQIVNPQRLSFTFVLIPPERRDYEPYRGTFMISDSTAEAPDPELPTPGETVYRAESFVSLSAPVNDIFTDNSLNRGWNIYAHVYTTTSNRGCRATMQVVDPGVRHNIPGNEFVVDHVYSAVPSSSQSIETGWCELSWQGDYRYLFERDTTNGTWRLICQVSPGYIQVNTYQYSGTTWITQWWNGSYWVQTGYVDVGFSTPTETENGGESYSDDGSWPSVPNCYTTSSYLNVSNTWDLWDNSYSTGTTSSSDLHISVLLSYYYFYIYN